MKKQTLLPTIASLGLLGLLIPQPAIANDFTIPAGTTTTAETLSNGQSGTVETGGTLSVTSGTVISVAGTSTASGNQISITNDGTITSGPGASGGRVVRDNSGGSNTLITNNAGALMQGAGNDVIAVNVKGSALTSSSVMDIENYGTIQSVDAGGTGATTPTAKGNQAINLTVETGSNIVNNYSTGVIWSTAADGVRPGTNGVVHNDGLIFSNAFEGSSSDGVDGQSSSGITIVNGYTTTTPGGTVAADQGAITGYVGNQADVAGKTQSTIEGGRHGITGGNTGTTGGTVQLGGFTGTGVYTMTITNNQGATIQGDDGSGINVDGFGIQGAGNTLVTNELVTVTNYGTITGNGVTGDGDGVDVDGNVIIDNYGSIISKNATPEAGSAPGAIEFSEGITVGGGTITNEAGATIEGQVASGNTQGVGRGITLAGIDHDVNDVDFAIQSIYENSNITNSGLIKGDSDSGIAVLGTTGGGYTVTIANSATGTIEGNNSGVSEDTDGFGESKNQAAIELDDTGNTYVITNYGKIQQDNTTNGTAVAMHGASNTLNIYGGAASIIGDISGDTAADSTLNINPGAGNSFSYGYKISNFTVQINSDGTDGTVTLSGANDYSGGTTLSGGSLVVANSAALGTGNMVNNGGTLETDGINRTIQVGGNYQQNSGTLLLGVNNTGNDRLQVTGAGSSNFNGTLDADFSGFTGSELGHVKTTQVFTLVTTVNGYTENLTFDATNLAAGNSATFDTTTNPDDIQVDVTTQAGLFTLGGLTPNQTAVGGYINRALNQGKTNALILAIGDAVTANPDALGGFLDQNSPLRFGTFASSIAFNNTAFLTQQFDDYLATHRGVDGTFIGGNGGIDCSGLVLNDPNVDSGLQMVHSRLLAWNPAPRPGLLSDMADPMVGGVDTKQTATAESQPTNPWNVFISGDVVLGQDFSDPANGLAHSDTTTGAVQMGADYRITPHFLVGALFGYGHTDADLDNIGSNASVDTYSPGVYASYSDSGWYANALASYGFSDYDQDRKVQVGAFNGTAHSSPTGDQIVGNLDGGYDFHRGNWTFGPTLGLQYVHLDVDGYNETGVSGANLDVNDNQADSLRSRLGGRVSYAIQDGGMTFTPHFSASWQHEFLDQSRGITSQFDGLGAGSFVVNTVNPSRDSALLDTGVDVQIDQTWTVFADYSVQAGQDNYFGQSVQAGVKVGF